MLGELRWKKDLRRTFSDGKVVFALVWATAIISWISISFRSNLAFTELSEITSSMALRKEAIAINRAVGFLWGISSIS